MHKFTLVFNPLESILKNSDMYVMYAEDGQNPLILDNNILTGYYIAVMFTK